MLQNIDDNDDNDNDVAKHKEPKSIKNAPTGTNTNWKTFCKSLLREDCQEVIFKIEETNLNYSSQNFVKKQHQYQLYSISICVSICVKLRLKHCNTTEIKHFLIVYVRVPTSERGEVFPNFNLLWMFL